jgi:hypothetical protein
MVRADWFDGEAAGVSPVVSVATRVTTLLPLLLTSIDLGLPSSSSA